jgi:hypothetical protein
MARDEDNMYVTPEDAEREAWNKRIVAEYEAAYEYTEVLDRTSAFIRTLNEIRALPEKEAA